jgi:hypothetical protein
VGQHVGRLSHHMPGIEANKNRHMWHSNCRRIGYLYQPSTFRIDSHAEYQTHRPHNGGPPRSSTTLNLAGPGPPGNSNAAHRVPPTVSVGSQPSLDAALVIRHGAFRLAGASADSPVQWTSCRFRLSLFSKSLVSKCQTLDPRHPQITSRSPPSGGLYASHGLSAMERRIRPLLPSIHGTGRPSSSSMGSQLQPRPSRVYKDSSGRTPHTKVACDACRQRRTRASASSWL